MQPRRVTFVSDGLKLVGHLYLPEPAGSTPLPAVLLTGPFTGVKEQVVGGYAAKFAERGLAALAFDHRNWGESEGEPRQHEDPTGKLADLRDALSFLQALPEIDADRIGLCGICMGGVYAALCSAFDPRVRAVTLVAGASTDPARMRTGFGVEAFRHIMGVFAEIAQREYETGEVEYWPAVSPDPTLWQPGDLAVGMPGAEPYEYYGTDRAASPHWQNRCTARSVKEELTLNSRYALPLIAPTPLLIVHGREDPYLPVPVVEEAYDAAGEPKGILWLDATKHIDLYDNDTYVNPAVDRAVAWYAEHLRPQAASRAGSRQGPYVVHQPASPRPPA